MQIQTNEFSSSTDYSRPLREVLPTNGTILSTIPYPKRLPTLNTVTQQSIIKQQLQIEQHIFIDEPSVRTVQMIMPFISPSNSQPASMVAQQMNTQP